MNARPLRALPNLLSSARLLLAAPLLLAIRAGETRAAARLLVAAAATDALDGWFARRLRAESAAGRVLDPLADKLLAAAAGFALWRWGDLPGWFLALLLLRDVLLLAGGALVARSRGEVPGSLRAGRVAFAVLAAVLFVFVVRARALYLAALAAGSVALAASLAVYALSLAAPGSARRTNRENP